MLEDSLGKQRGPCRTPISRCRAGESDVQPGPGGHGGVDHGQLGGAGRAVRRAATAVRRAAVRGSAVVLLGARGLKCECRIGFCHRRHQDILPVEVKAGKTGTLRSLFQFLREKNRQRGCVSTCDHPYWKTSNCQARKAARCACCPCRCTWRGNWTGCWRKPLARGPCAIDWSGLARRQLPAPMQ